MGANCCCPSCCCCCRQPPCPDPCWCAADRLPLARRHTCYVKMFRPQSSSLFQAFLAWLSGTAPVRAATLALALREAFPKEREFRDLLRVCVSPSSLVHRAAH